MSEDYNDMTKRLLKDLVKHSMNEGGGYAEILVALESILLGVMMFQAQYFKMGPNVSVELVEAALQRAVERFADQNQKNKFNV